VIQATAPTIAERREQLERPGAAIPPAWEELVGACLAKQAEQRPPTVLEVIRRLDSQSTAPADGNEAVPLIRPPDAAVPATEPPAKSKWLEPPPPPTLPDAAFAASPPTRAHTAPPPPPVQRRSKAVAVAIFSLIGILAAVAGILIATKKDAESPRTGRIIVNTTPSGAGVFVDGRNVGTSPTTVSNIEPGDHQVRLEKAEYEPLDLTIHVEPGSTVDRGAFALTAAPKPPPKPIEAAQPDPVPPKPPAPTGLTDTAARELAEGYVTFTRQRSVVGLLQCYADRVDYHDEGFLDHAKLRTSINAYFREWPYFDIQVLSTNVSPTNDPEVKNVQVDYRFLAKNGSKNSSGIAHDVLTVQRLGDQTQITKFRQTVTDRKKNF
jgi:hypothetical protein